MVRNGGVVNFRDLFAAIEEERIDVLQTLLWNGRVDDRVNSEGLVQRARNMGNEEVIAVVERFAREEMTSPREIVRRRGGGKRGLLGRASHHNVQQQL
jgi:hypothetical protein